MGVRLALAIVLGILVGFLSLLPLYAGIRVVERIGAQQTSAGYLGPVLLAVGGSIIILAFATIICAVMARSYIGPFVLAEAGTLIVATLVFGFVKALRNK